jgi:hypothetical protein
VKRTYMSERELRRAARGFRKFLLRGLAKVQPERKMICAPHPSADGLKLFQSGWSPQSA